MYIEPAEYLDLSDRLQVISRKYEIQCSQNALVVNKCIAYEQKIKFLQSRISELLDEKNKQKQSLKQHITSKAQLLIQKIAESKQSEMAFIDNKINKLRNQSAMNTLQKLQQRIVENRTVTFEKDFYQKVKTLHLLESKKLGCTSVELFQWVRNLTDLNKKKQKDVLGGVQNISMALGTQKSIKKTLKSSNIHKKSNKKIQNNQQNQQLAKNSLRNIQKRSSKQPMLQNPIQGLIQQDPLSQVLNAN